MNKSKKNLIVDGEDVKPLLNQKKFVILHPVWNKYQKETTKNVDSNVENLSNHREKGSDGQQRFPLKASYKA